MSEDHMDEFEHYNFDQDKHVNMSGHSGKVLNLARDLSVSLFSIQSPSLSIFVCYSHVFFMSKA